MSIKEKIKKIDEWRLSSFEPHDHKDRKLHWFVRFYLWTFEKLVIDKIKIDTKDIKFVDTRK